MANELNYFLKHVGDVLIRKRRGSRRLSIRVGPSGEVRMIIPYTSSFNTAINFLEGKQEWILKTRERIKKHKPEKKLFSDDNLPRTRHHEFLITRVKNKDMSFTLSPGLCEIFIPQDMEPESETVQSWIKRAYTETLRREAKVILVKRCSELAQKHGFQIKDIRVKDMKTRWGSCSSKGNINLNLHLMRLPGHLVDYVIFHELVHTIHPNHSEAFWKELDKFAGNSKKLSKETRSWGSVLYNF